MALTEGPHRRPSQKALTEGQHLPSQGCKGGAVLDVSDAVDPGGFVGDGDGRVYEHSTPTKHFDLQVQCKEATV